MNLSNFLRALDYASQNEQGQSQPFLVHGRTLLRLTKQNRSVPALTLAQSVTETLPEYLCLYAGDAFGAVEDYVFISRDVSEHNRHLLDALIVDLSNVPDSTVGSYVPDYVQRWIDGDLL